MSMFKKVLTIGGFGVGAAFMSGGQADALSNNGVTATADITVTATVQNTCNFAADGALAFGLYDGGTGTSGSATLQLNCTSGAVLDVDIDNGSGFDGTYRTMDGAVGTPLQYELCQDSTADGICNTPWGSGIAGGTMLSFTGTGANAPVVVNGWIPGAQTVLSSPNYQDVVTVSVNY